MADMETESEEKCRLCEDCNKAFDTEIDFEVHLCYSTRKCPLLCYSEKRHRKGIHCCLCGRKFIGRSELKNHINTHTGEKPHVCPHCQFRSATSSYLKVHIVRKHTKEFKHHCSFCSKGYVHNSELQKHIQKVHKKKEKGGVEEENKKQPVQMYCCPHCTFVTKIKRNIQRHLWTHSNYRPYRCEFCNKGYTKSDQYMDHLRTHTGERPFICNTCDRGFFSKSSLRAHERLHPEEKIYLKNPSKGRIRRKKPKPVFQGNTEERFVLLHSEVGEEMHRCLLCPFSASSELSIKAHLRTHSSELGRCEFCDRVVANKEDHLAHCKEEQTVRCKFCKKAVLKKEIEEHQSACKEEYPFVCLVCGEKFRCQSVLQLHESCLHKKSRVQKMHTEISRIINSCSY